MNPNPLDGTSTVRDAAIVATFVMCLLLFTVFLPTYALAAIKQDLEGFSYSLMIFLGGTWFSVFGSVSGLTIYAQSSQKKQDEG